MEGQPGSATPAGRGAPGRATSGQSAAGQSASGRSTSGRSTSGLPRPLLAAAGLVGLEAVALLVLGVLYAVRGVVGSPDDRTGTVIGGLLAVLVGAGLLAAARALARSRPWSVSPTVVVQLMIVVVAVGLLQGGVLAVGLPLLGCAAAVLAGLVAPASRARLRRAG